MDTAPECSAMCCPRCGGDNRCEIESGHPCWCATEFAPALALPKESANCYCRRCLSELIEERRRAQGLI